MKLKMRYENEYQTITVDTNELKAWLNITEEPGESDEDVEKRIQDAVDEEFNKPEYNNWHRETRHIDPTPKRKRMDGRRGYIQADTDDSAFDIMDYLLTTSDEHEDLENETVHQLVREACGSKTEWADMFIAIRLDGMSVNDYATQVGADPSNISHKLDRATQKIKKFLENRQI